MNVDPVLWIQLPRTIRDQLEQIHVLYGARIPEETYKQISVIYETMAAFLEGCTLNELSNFCEAWKARPQDN